MAIYMRARELQRIYRSRGYSKSALSRALGVSRPYVVHILNTGVPVGPRFIEAVLTHTDYTFEQAFYFARNPDRQTVGKGAANDE